MLLIVAHIYREAPPYFVVVYLFIILYIFWSRRSDLSTATQRANSRIAQQPTALELMELSILFASVLHSFLEFAKKKCRGDEEKRPPKLHKRKLTEVERRLLVKSGPVH